MPMTGMQDESEAIETDGTYNGAQGTYTCNATGTPTVRSSSTRKAMITAMTDRMDIHSR